MDRREFFEDVLEKMFFFLPAAPFVVDYLLTEDDDQESDGYETNITRLSQTPPEELPELPELEDDRDQEDVAELEAEG